jgi:hypothetical protein
MKYIKTIYTLVLMSSLTMPVLASANGLQYSKENQNAPSPFILKVQDWQKERGGSGIFSYGSEMFREFRDRSSEHESRDRSSDTDMRSYSDFPGPSFDIPNSVDGHSRAVNPWWDRRSSADPMIRNLSEMDSGFSDPGSASPSLGR